MKYHLPLRIKIMLLVILILNMVLLIIGVIICEHVKNNEIKQLSRNAENIAKTVARIPILAEYIGRVEGAEIIQDIADEIRKETQAAFVVIMDMDGIRYSHPVQERIGQHFVGGDELDVLTHGYSYVSKAVGTLGPSIRAFEPIYKEGKQVGAVSVGILLEDINNRIKSILSTIYMAFFFGDCLGVVGSIIMAHNVKKSIFGLEPIEIARIFQEKNAIIDSIKEGVIAIDKEQKITLANKEAKNILNCQENLEGKKIRNVIKNSRLPELLKTGTPEYNYEQIICGTVVLTNRVPVIIEGQIVGAVASFNKKTEVQQLAQELSGVKKFADALRSQNHEYMNLLHTISGMIQLGKTEDVLRLISNITSKKQELTSFITKNIKVNEIAGLLLGKFDRASELKINLIIDQASYLPPLTNQDYKEGLVTIIGNLIENAMESLHNTHNDKKEVYVSIIEKEKKIMITVKDTGIGIIPSLQEKIFERGFSTKEGENRGIGLDLVKRKVDFLGGELTLNTKPGEGSRFKVIIPLP